jgi:hypothetical protein
MRSLWVNLSAADIDDRGASSHDIESFCRKGHFCRPSREGRFRPTKVGHGPSAITLVMRVAYHLT